MLFNSEVNTLITVVTTSLTTGAIVRTTTSNASINTFISAKAATKTGARIDAIAPTASANVSHTSLINSQNAEKTGFRVSFQTVPTI